MSDSGSNISTAPPRRKRGRPPVIVGDQRHLSFQAPAEQARLFEELLPRRGQRSQALREALSLVLQRLTSEQEQAAYQSLYEKYMDPRRALNKRNVVTVVHPALHSKGIRQVYFFSADSPRTSEGVGVTVVKMIAKEFNSKTRINDGSSKPKPAQFNAGALDSNNLNGRTPFRVVPASASVPANTVPLALARDTSGPPPSRTVGERRTAAAKGS